MSSPPTASGKLFTAEESPPTFTPRNPREAPRSLGKDSLWVQTGEDEWTNQYGAKVYAMRNGVGKHFGDWLPDGRFVGPRIPGLRSPTIVEGEYPSPSGTSTEYTDSPEASTRNSIAPPGELDDSNRSNPPSRRDSTSQLSQREVSESRAEGADSKKSQRPTLLQGTVKALRAASSRVKSKAKSKFSELTSKRGKDSSTYPNEQSFRATECPPPGSDTLG